MKIIEFFSNQLDLLQWLSSIMVMVISILIIVIIFLIISKIIKDIIKTINDIAENLKKLKSLRQKKSKATISKISWLKKWLKKIKWNMNVTNFSEKIILLNFITISLILLIIAFIISLKTKDVKILNEIHLVKLVFVLEIIYFLSSLKKIDVDKIGAILFFGKPIEDVGPGFCFVPFLIMELKTETRLIIQDELPCEPEKIWRAEDHGNLTTPPPGYFPPIRITFGPPEKDETKPNFIEGNNPYDKQMTVEVVPVISWRIIKYTVFLGEIGTIENAKKQMEDVAITQFAADFAKITPAVALKGLDSHSQTLRAAIEERVKSWKVEIVSAQIKPFIFNHDLNIAVIKVSEAEQQKKADITKSEGTSQKIRNEGDALAETSAKKIKLEGVELANARELLLKAEAIGVEELSKVAQTEEGKITLWLDTMKTALEKSNHTIIPGGDFFSALAGINEIITAAKKGGVK